MCLIRPRVTCSPSSQIPLDDVVQILALAQANPARQRAVIFECLDCGGVDGILVHIHHAGYRVLLRSKDFAEEAFGSFRVTFCCQQEIDRLADLRRFFAILFAWANGARSPSRTVRESATAWTS